MPSFRLDRTSEDIKRELTDIMRTLKDPRINGLLSILKVDLSKDLSLCRVYISSLDGIDAAVSAVKGLNSAARNSSRNWQRGIQEFYDLRQSNGIPVFQRCYPIRR